jgi:demethylmenaquinone methyltransferase/2-methoxy-6-polyprenyl-1,4-benzoquinol methylase
MEDGHSIIQEQIVYYQARAPEYDEWFLRQGRYDRGSELNRQWFQEVEQVRISLNQFRPEGDVLELACGTGWWTKQLLSHARHITAVDTAAEAIKLNQQRLQSSNVEYIQADIFSWQPEERYDVVFFSFWLSHVPSQYFQHFWQMVTRALKPGGRVFFMDSRYEPTSTARDHPLGEAQAGLVRRKLNDGREYQIVKIFFEREQLEKRLGKLGWNVRVNETPNYFLFGEGGVG